MGNTADKITRIVALEPDASSLLRALDDGGEAQRSASQTVRGLDHTARQSLAMIEIGHAVDRITDIVVPLKEEHDSVMKGEGTACRHLEVQEKRFLRYALLFVAVPTLFFIIRTVAPIVTAALAAK